MQVGRSQSTSLSLLAPFVLLVALTGPLLAAGGCKRDRGGAPGEPPGGSQRQPAAVLPPATSHDPECEKAQRLLEQGKLAEARAAADAVLARTAGDPHAHVVVALAEYLEVARSAWIWGRQVLTPPRDVLSEVGRELARDLARELLPGSGKVLSAMARSVLEDYAKRLRAVSEHVEAARAAADGGFSVRVVPANLAWDRDGDGQISPEERELFEVQVDVAGEPLPAGDPRRTPTFRLDIGDLSWALAYLSFQRAALEAVLAFEIEALDVWELRRTRHLRVALRDPKRITEVARGLVLGGLAESGRARAAYLAETDDELEWIPSPKQKNQGVPLPVDEALYERWDRALGAAGRLVEGKEALDVDEIAAAVSSLACSGSATAGDPYLCQPVKTGVRIDVGRAFREPRSADINIGGMARAQTFAGSLAAAAGAFTTTELPPSSLVGELRAVASEWPEARKKSAEAADRVVDMKLRYLMWIN